MIYKYPLGFLTHQKLRLPRGAKILDVQNQKGFPVLWADVDTDVDTILRSVYVIPTGAGVSHDKPHTYLSSVQFEEGSLVYHFFIEDEPLGRH